MVETFRRTAEASWFQRGITGVIVLAGVIAGIETYPELIHAYGPVLHVLDKLILIIFILELVVKMGAHGSQPWRYFRDPWNIFDFIIVVVALLPIGSQGVAVLRLARLLRVLKLVRALPRLQLLVSALLKSIPSMGYVSLLLGLLFYLYGVAATHLFGPNDPVHFGRLESSLLTLFQVVTLEGWADLMYTQVYGCAEYGYDGFPGLCTQSTTHPLLAPLFFLSFILLGTMVVLNLFVGVIMKGMEEAQEEHLAEEMARARAQGSTLDSEMMDLERELDEVVSQLERVKRMAHDHLRLAARQ
jgi:voltage-gated sodium channel